MECTVVRSLAQLNVLSPLSIPCLPPVFRRWPTSKAPSLELLCFISRLEAVGWSPQLEVDDGTGGKCPGLEEKSRWSWDVDKVPSLCLSIPQDVPQRTINGLDSKSIYRSAEREDCQPGRS